MTVDIRPTTEEVVAYIGASLELTYTVQDAAGQAVDLSGSNSKMLLKRSRDDADSTAVAEFSLDPAAPADGQCTATLSAGQTANLEPGVYYADHHVHIPDGSEYIVASFIIRFERPVTRAV